MSERCLTEPDLEALRDAGELIRVASRLLRARGFATVADQLDGVLDECGELEALHDRVVAGELDKLESAAWEFGKALAAERAGG